MVHFLKPDGQSISMREEFVFFQAQDHFSPINCLPLRHFRRFF